MMASGDPLNGMDNCNKFRVASSVMLYYSDFYITNNQVSALLSKVSYRTLLKRQP